MLKFRIPLLLLAGSLLGQASPIAYNISFTGGSGPMLGSFTYDSAVPTFSNFKVTWNGAEFDLTSPANSGPPSGFCGLSSGAAGSFDLLNGQFSSSCNNNWISASDGSIAAFAFYVVRPPGASSDFFYLQRLITANVPALNDSGDFKIAAVPEPTTAGVTLFVLAGLGLAAKRRCLH